MNIFFHENQQALFFVMTVVGLISGFVFDIFKIKQNVFGKNTFVVLIDDLIFSVITILLFLFSVFIFNNGVFRWFELLFYIVGFYLYRVSVSRIFVLSASFVLRIPYIFVIWLIKTLIRPFSDIICPLFYALRRQNALRHYYIHIKNLLK